MSTLIKRILLFLLFLCFLAILLINPIFEWQRGKWSSDRFSYTSIDSQDEFVEIVWQSDAIGNDTIEKTAFFVSPKISKIHNQNSYMQFDTGSASTLLYGNSLKALHQDSVQLKFNLDSSYVYNFEMKLGHGLFKADSIRVMKDYGMNKYNPEFFNIGTIGYDLIYGRTLIMDFKTDMLAITDNDASIIAPNIPSAKNTSIDKFPPFINATLNGKEMKLMYDTGSSMFTLITNPKKIKDFGNPVDTICCINAWGTKYPIYKSTVYEKFEIGQLSNDSIHIYGFPRMDHVVLDYLPWSMFFGITGNKIFYDKTVVMDTENNEFVVY